MNRVKPWLSYVIAFVSVALATVGAVMLDNYDKDPTPMFVLAVIWTAWYGGVWPALLATALAAATSTIIFIEPPHTPGFGVDDAVNLALFLFVALVISYLQFATRRSMRELRRAKETAEQANRSKDHFLAVLSHELRTPLNPALAAVSVLETDATLPQTAREDLGLIRRNIELETRLIEDLLDIARLNRGKLSMQPQTVDVHGALRDAIRICEADIRNKQIALSTDLRAARHIIRADPARLRQVFWNLLRNAVKFTPSGGTISIRTCDRAPSTEAPESRLEIEIQDSGIGIEPRSLGRIFQPFEQGDPSIASRFGGMGLGLAITRQLVALHGGELSASSAGKNQGATFRVLLPATPVQAAPVPSDSKAPAEAADASEKSTAACASRRLRLLLVEDHEDTLRLIARLLNHANHDVTAVNSIGAALESAAKTHFDLVISDLGLPDGTGYDLMRQIRAMYGGEPHAIALSGYGSAEDVASSRNAGFERHLTKPIDFQQLQEAIEQVVCSTAK